MRIEITTAPNLAPVTPTLTDLIVLQDASDSNNLKTATATDILALSALDLGMDYGKSYALSAGLTLYGY